MKFTVLLESSKSFPEQPWEAIIWHNAHEDREWRELQLEEQPASCSPVILRWACASEELHELTGVIAIG